MLQAESRARTPIKGLRQRLRVTLKAAGVTCKFGTDLHRNGDLLVSLGERIMLDTLPKEHEGRRVRYSVKTQ